MDFDLFRFWSDSFSNAARAEKQMGDAFGLAREGFSSFRDFNLFWQKMMYFPPPLAGLFSAFGLVPMQEHLSLVRRYEEVKERVAAHEETIKHLRLLLNSKGCEREGLQTGIQDLVKIQMDAFFALMRGMQLLPYK